MRPEPVPARRSVHPTSPGAAKCRSRRCRPCDARRRPDRPIRPKRITQDCQLLLYRPAASTGYLTDNLDTTGRMTSRDTCRWFDSIVRHHGPVQRAAINPSNAPAYKAAFRPRLRSHFCTDGDPVLPRNQSSTASKNAGINRQSMIVCRCRLLVVTRSECAGC
jgi:hypothetical protein